MQRWQVELHAVPCVSTTRTFQTNSGVMVSWMRTTPRVMGCRLACRSRAGKDFTQEAILSPVTV